MYAHDQRSKLVLSSTPLHEEWRVDDNLRTGQNRLYDVLDGHIKLQLLFQQNAAYAERIQLDGYRGGTDEN